MNGQSDRWRGAGLAMSMVALILLLAPYEGLATAQDASIFGQVKDESGAVQPGVTVAASGLALQVGSVSDVTDENGQYRLTPCRSAHTRLCAHFWDSRLCSVKASC